VFTKWVKILQSFGGGGGGGICDSYRSFLNLFLI